MRSLLLSVLLVSLAFLGAAWLILRPCLAADFIRRIVGIIDGDTLEVLHNQHPERIRLGGIDCLRRAKPAGREPSRSPQNLSLGRSARSRPTTSTSTDTPLSM